MITKNPNFLIWYKYLEVLNLVRIMPYVSDKIEIKFLENNINNIKFKI